MCLLSNGFNFLKGIYVIFVEITIAGMCKEIM